MVISWMSCIGICRIKKLYLNNLNYKLMFSNNMITTVYSSRALLFKTAAFTEKIKNTIFYYILNSSVSLYRFNLELLVSQRELIHFLNVFIPRDLTNALRHLYGCT